MENKWLYGIIGLLSGILIAVLTVSSAVNNNSQGMMRMMGIRTDNMMEEREEIMHGNGMQATMNDMTVNLKSKTDEEFDKAFISEMIVHHQGAIDMANAAKTNAKHDEIKAMAGDIISAQTKEINQMKEWQKTWGY